MIRNDCLGAMFIQPIPLPLVTVPMRLARYGEDAHGGRRARSGGLLWILGQLAAQLPRRRAQRAAGEMVDAPALAGVAAHLAAYRPRGSAPAFGACRRRTADYWRTRTA